MQMHASTTRIDAVPATISVDFDGRVLAGVLLMNRYGRTADLSLAFIRLIVLRGTFMDRSALFWLAGLSFS
ncbi:hypothetical protein [Nocardia sp. CA-290969]|uniref:hypothetical protein n=1 Tax=Nocardia sp. CA-290969 TaxID=3239986 RepID=UPI003D8AB1F5